MWNKDPYNPPPAANPIAAWAAAIAAEKLRRQGLMGTMPGGPAARTGGPVATANAGIKPQPVGPPQPVGKTPPPGPQPPPKGVTPPGPVGPPLPVGKDPYPPKPPTHRIAPPISAWPPWPVGRNR